MLVSAQIIMAVAYMVGGWLVQTIPLAQLTLVIVGSFALSILMAAGLTVPQREKTAEEAAHDNESVWQSFMSGLRYLRRHPIARPLTVMETVEHIPHGIWTGAVMLAFTVEALNGTAVEWGYLVTGYFGGLIAGSLAALAMSDWLGRYPGRIIVFNAALSGIMTFLFGLSTTVWFAVTMGVIFGPPFAIRDVAQDSLLQGTVDEAQLGRVYATREMLRSAVFMFSGLFFAWLSDFVPIRQIYMIGGVMYVLTGVYALSNKPLRESSMVSEVDTA